MKKKLRLWEVVESPKGRLSSKRVISISFAIAAIATAFIIQNEGIVGIFAAGAIGGGVSGIFEKRD